MKKFNEFFEILINSLFLSVFIFSLLFVLVFKINDQLALIFLLNACFTFAAGCVCRVCKIAFDFLEG